MKRFRPLILLAVTLALAAIVAISENLEAKSLPLTQDQLAGDWDALVEDEPRIFVMKLRAPKVSTITMIAGLPAGPDKFVFTIKRIHLESTGNLYLEATDSTNGLTMKFRGKGLGKRNAGQIVGNVEISGKPGFGATVFRTTFRSRGTPGYFTILKSLLEAAQK